VITEVNFAMNGTGNAGLHFYKFEAADFENYIRWSERATE
jgi:hypothetical protein